MYMKGGAFLYEKTSAKDAFVPEEFNEEQLMIKDMIIDFVNQEVLPNLDKLDSREHRLGAVLKTVIFLLSRLEKNGKQDGD